VTRVGRLVSGLLAFGLCCAYSSDGRANKAETTMAQVMAMDMSGGHEASRAHPDWDALIDKYASGDQIYFIDCRKAEPSHIFAGTSLYVLVRQGVVIARALGTVSN
jgi:hypothetical protein